MTSGKTSIIQLYKNVDKWKRLHHKQILFKHNLKKKYNKLMVEYKELLVENNEIKRGNRNSW